MEPILVIVWIAVAVFALTSLISVLYLAGLITVNPEHGKYLFRILIAEIAILSVSTFGYYLKTQGKPKDQLLLPVSNFMLIEQNPIVAFKDNSGYLFIRADDVSRARRSIDISLSNQDDFSEALQEVLVPGTSKIIDVSGKKYYLFFEQMGNIDGDPKKKGSRPKDFVFISIKQITTDRKDSK